MLALLVLSLIVLAFVIKNIKPARLMEFGVMMLFAMPVLAFAQDSVTLPPEWLESFLLTVAAIPKVGPIIVEVFKWLGVIASVFTALSVALTVIVKIPEVTARWAGADEFADSLAEINKKIQPWLKYLSVFNVQKK